MNFTKEISLASIFIMFFILSFYIFKIRETENLKKKVLGKKVENISDRDFKIVKLNKFIKRLEIFLTNLKLEKYTFLILLSISIIIFLTSLFLISVKQIFVAIINPIAFLYLSDYILKILCDDEETMIEEQLPLAIDNIIRVFSKYGDVKNVFYEVSKISPNPIKNIFYSMSKDMLSERPENVIMRYANKYDNVWFYSFAFTMVSYLEDSTKEETIKNLKSLRDILEKENNRKKMSIADKKYGVAVSLTICGLAVIAFLLNLMYTPKAKYFYFSTSGGFFCFVAGFLSIIVTIITSIKFSKKKKG